MTPNPPASLPARRPLSAPLLLAAAALLTAGVSSAQQPEAPDPPPPDAPLEPSAPQPPVAPPPTRSPAPPPHAAAAPSTASPGDAPPAPRLARQWGVWGGLGARYSQIKSTGYDPFATKDLLVQFNLNAGAQVLRLGSFSLGVTGGWDIGASGSTARGAQSSLTMHRLWAGPEARVSLFRWLYVFGRAAPAALHARATLTDASSAEPLASKGWTWGLDLSGGGALEMFHVGNAEGPTARFWVIAEAGYGFAGRIEQNLTPRLGDDDPRTFGTTRLAPLDASGALARVSFAISLLRLRSGGSHDPRLRPRASRRSERSRHRREASRRRPCRRRRWSRPRWWPSSRTATRPDLLRRGSARP
jgi:hypothetical protein